MNFQLVKHFREIRGSYWFLPALMVLGAVLLALGMNRLDTHVDLSTFRSTQWLYQSQPAGARSVLSAIATSMIGVAGVTFSMTIVTVAFAAGNIGPRLIGNFMRDTGNQVTLGTFTATFVYCLLILRTVTDAAGESSSAFVPHLSLLVALALALLSISNLIYFIHHIPDSINVARIAYLIGNDLRSSMTTLFPDDIGTTRDREAGPLPQLGAQFRSESRAVLAKETGYLQAIDDEALIEIARDNNLVLRIEYRPGDFALAESTVLYAHPAERVDDTVSEQLTACVMLGSKRTAVQNAMFLVDQLVEIMLRALSPGINDPFTAVGCLDWLQAALSIVVRRGEPASLRYDEEGALRVAVHAVSLERFASAVFDQPLQYVAADRTASLRTMQVIAELVSICDNPDYTKLLLTHARKLNDAGRERLPVQSDRTELALRYEQTVRIANDPAYRQKLRDGQGWLGGRG